MIILSIMLAAAGAAEALPGSSDFWQTLISNAPGLGAVGLVVALLFRTYWRAEDKDERQAQRMERELESLRKENEQLRHFIAKSIMGITHIVTKVEREMEEAQDQDR